MIMLSYISNANVFDDNVSDAYISDAYVSDDYTFDAYDSDALPSVHLSLCLCVNSTIVLVGVVIQRIFEYLKRKQRRYFYFNSFDNKIVQKLGL